MGWCVWLVELKDRCDTNHMKNGMYWCVYTVFLGYRVEVISYGTTRWEESGNLFCCLVLIK